MKFGHLQHNRFLDLEAEVDRELDTDKDEEQDMEDMFINDLEEDTLISAHRTLHNNERQAEEDALGIAYDNLLDRVHGNSRVQTRNTNTFDHDYYNEVLPKHICLTQRNTDYPLYKVDCKVGCEELIIMNLLSFTNEKLQLRAAFTPGHTRGCVYLECTMNDHLKHHLLQIYGINHTRQGIRYRIINPQETHQLLLLPKNNRTVEIGDWVRIKKGAYKGDTGKISKTHNWGVCVLLVPRIDYTPIDSKQQKQKQKRKMSTVKPPPRLFDSNEFHNATNIEPRKKQEGTYRVGRMEFVHGLLLKSYDFSSISPPVFDIPWNLAAIFASTNNNDIISRMPRPQEWILNENDKIVLLSSGEKGFIYEIKGEYAMIDIGERGIHPIIWYDIRKDITLGDYVSIASGPHSRYKGWVIEMAFDVATVLKEVLERNNPDDKSYDDTPIKIHVNCVQITDPPFHFPTQPSNSKLDMKRAIRHPWYGTTVCITKLGHPRKGEELLVIDASHEQDAASVSGIKVQLQTLSYNPHMPYAKITIDHDDIIETSTRKSLKDFFKTRNTNITPTIQHQDTTLSTTDFSGFSTPMPTESSSTPAWDPSSQTPMHNDQGTSSLQTVNTIVPSPPEHILLNRLLLDVVVKAIVDGGRYKKQSIDVHITHVDGKFGLYHHHFKTYIPLEPGWVTPKHPSPTHDHGLLVIIEGEHCGKYVRRISHLNRNNGTVIILAVVNRTKGCPDTLTGEQLTLPANILCKSFEVDKERSLNDAIMAPLRKPYR